MTIENLAKQYKLKTKKEGSGDDVEVIIPGKLGHIFIQDESEDLVGAIFMPEEPSKGWKARREAFLKAGATLKQNGDTEGSVVFTSDNKEAMKVAIKALGITKKRKVNPETVKRLSETLKRAREIKAAKIS